MEGKEGHLMKVNRNSLTFRKKLFSICDHDAKLYRTKYITAEVSYQSELLLGSLN